MIHWREEWSLFWPDYDAYPERTYAHVLTHLPDMDMTLAACKQSRTCIQAGGHVGLWPIKLSRYFDTVISFEPDPALFECLRKNTEAIGNAIVSPNALGAATGKVLLEPHPKAGSWAVSPTGSVEVKLQPIDELGLLDCDAIVLDVEGYEVEALKGAKETIAASSPVIHVEQLRQHRKASDSYLRSIGYRERGRAGNDSLYVK